MSALRDPDGNGFSFKKNKNIAAFERRIFCTVIPNSGIFVHGMVSKDVFRKQRLPRSRFCAHFMNGNAVSHRSESPPWKIKIRHGINQEKDNHHREF